MPEPAIYMDLLSPERRSAVIDRFNQSPQQWPAGMREGVSKLAKLRSPMCSEDVIEVIAEWMYLNPEV